LGGGLGELVQQPLPQRSCGLVGGIEAGPNKVAAAGGGGDFFVDESGSGASSRSDTPPTPPMRTLTPQAIEGMKHIRSLQKLFEPSTTPATGSPNSASSRIKVVDVERAL
jgi:hypothetical protein